MSSLFSEKKTWSDYFSNWGKTISKGTTDVLKSAESIADDSKNSINSTLGTKMGGKRGKRSHRRVAGKTHRKKSRRNNKSRRK